MSASGAFYSALCSFKQKLTQNQRDSFQHTTAEDVISELNAIQAEQEKRGSLRNLRRIEPFIQGINQFSEVLGILVQAKPEILAFIWGPTKFLLQVASTYIRTFDKLLDVLQRIGENLPRFDLFNTLFCDSAAVQQVLVSFYQEMLSFYTSALKFFRKKTWKIAVLSLWSPFEHMFGSTLQGLSRHQERIDKEAAAAQMVQQHKQQLTEDLERWLNPVNYDHDLHRYVEMRTPKTTGLWLIQNDRVKTWLNPDPLDGRSRLLWLTGIPGSGKTILSASLIDHARSIQGSQNSVVYAFLRNGEDDRNTFVAVIQTLIHQLWTQNRSLDPLLRRKHDSTEGCPPRTPEQLEELFELILDNVDLVSLIVDGLDEIDVEERSKILIILLSLIAKAENLRVFISSRNETDIFEMLSYTGPLHVGMQNAADIDAYVKSEGEEVIRKFTTDITTRHKVESAVRAILGEVSQKAHEMFLLARLIMRDLLGQTTLQELKAAGRSLPSGLNEAYGRILERFRSPNSKLSDTEKIKARRILVWVLCAVKPLRSMHIKKLLAIQTGDRYLDSERELLRRLEELCGPLIDIDPVGNARLVHFTAKEYLTGPESGVSQSDEPFIHPAEAHMTVASKCLTYLSFDCFSSSQEDDNIIQNILSGSYFFHEYAEMNWVHHVKHAAEAITHQEQISDLVEPLANFIGNWRVPNAPYASSYDQNLICTRKVLHDLYADVNDYFMWNLTSENLSHPGQNPWSLRQVVNRIRGIMESLAKSAMDNKDVERLELLKQSFGDKLFKCKYPRCDSYIEGFATKKERDSHINQHLRPFKCEVQTCFYSTIGFAKLMELENHMAEKHQTDIDSPDLSDLLPMLTIAEPDNPDFDSADVTALLFDAISMQNADTVRDCLAQTPDLHKRNEEGMCVLQHCTTMGGSVEIAELLINAGAQADENLQLPFPSNIRIRSTPLFMAAELGHEAMVRLLLEKGANPEIYNQYGKLPWHSAANRGDETTAIIILKKQLERSTNAQTIDWLRTTSFATAVEEGYGAIVSFLSEEAFDINTKDRNGNSALFCAAAQNRETTIRILLDNGADIETTNDRSVTPLIGAAQAGYRAVVQILLDRGANIEAKNNLGQTSLASALQSLSSCPPSSPSSNLLLEVIQLLLDNGANLDAETGQRVLFNAAGYGSEPLVRLLLQKGSDVNEIDSRNKTPLESAVMGGHEGVVRLLLQSGANRESSVRALKEAIESKKSSFAIAQLLLDGIHPVAGTLCLAAKQGDEDMVRLLLEKGSDVNETDSHNKTPLESAVMGGHEGVVRLLLQNGANRESGVGALRETIESEKSSFAIAQLLLDGIHPAAGTLCFAARWDNEDMVRLLLEKGSDIDETGTGYLCETPLGYAVLNNRVGITRILLEKGANPNIKFSSIGERRTLLYHSVNKGTRNYVPLIQLLLSYGADPRAESPSGKPICSLGAWKKMVKWGVPDVKDEPTTNPNVMQE